MSKAATHVETAGERWLHGVEQFQREYAPVAEEIREMVAKMPHNTIEDSMKVVDAVVDAVVDRNRRFAEAYRAKHKQHTDE